MPKTRIDHSNITAAEQVRAEQIPKLRALSDALPVMLDNPEAVRIGRALITTWIERTNPVGWIAERGVTYTANWLGDQIRLAAPGIDLAGPPYHNAHDATWRLLAEAAPGMRHHLHGWDRWALGGDGGVRVSLREPGHYSGPSELLPTRREAAAVIDALTEAGITKWER